MTPVIYMSDAFVANGAEPWQVPSLDDLPDISVGQRGQGRGHRSSRTPATPRRSAGRGRSPARPGLEHRIGGLEKADGLGNVSYDADNHHQMTLLCAQARSPASPRDIPPLDVFGPEQGDLLILGWGSTYGVIRSAVERMHAEGLSVAHAHLRYLNPFPANTGDVLRRYRTVLVPELNLGQLAFLLRGTYLVDAVGYNRVKGKPFRIQEIVDEAARLLDERGLDRR